VFFEIGAAGGDLAVNLLRIEGGAAVAALFSGEFDGFSALRADFGLLLNKLAGVAASEGRRDRRLDFRDQEGEKQAEGPQEQAQGEPGAAGAALVGRGQDRAYPEKHPNQGDNEHRGLSKII
jgi:hypothetical protein